MTMISKPQIHSSSSSFVTSSPPRSIDYGGILVAFIGFLMHGMGAYVQLNDPEPFWWIVAYSIVSLLCVYVMMIKGMNVTKIPMEMYMYVWYIFIIPFGLFLRSFGKLYTFVYDNRKDNEIWTNLRTYTVQDWLEIEAVRELFGTVILLLWEGSLFPWCIDYTGIITTKRHSFSSATIITRENKVIDSSSTFVMDDPKPSTLSSTTNSSNSETTNNIVDDNNTSSTKNTDSLTANVQLRQRYKVDGGATTTSTLSTKFLAPATVRTKASIDPTITCNVKDYDRSDYCTLSSPPSLLTIGTILAWVGWLYALKEGNVHVDAHCQGMLV